MVNKALYNRLTSTDYGTYSTAASAGTQENCDNDVYDVGLGLLLLSDRSERLRLLLLCRCITWRRRRWSTFGWIGSHLRKSVNRAEVCKYTVYVHMESKQSLRPSSSILK